MVRFKNRWLLLQIDFESYKSVELSNYHFLSELKNDIQELFGEVGAAELGNILVKYYSPHTGLAIVRVTKDFYKKAWTALFFKSTLKRKRCAISVVHCSGTIKLLQKKAIELDRQMIRELRLNQKVGDEKAGLLKMESEKSIMAISQ